MTLNLTMNHVRNKFRKLPASSIRTEHLQTAARKRAGEARGRGEEVIVSAAPAPVVTVIQEGESLQEILARSLRGE